MNAKIRRVKVAKSAKAATVANLPQEIEVPAEVVTEPAATETGTALVVADAPHVADLPAIPVTQLKRVAEESAQPEQEQPEAAQPEIAVINGCKAQVQKAKPQMKMMRRIKWIGQHPGRALRIKRWHMYSLGMTLQQCKETEGLSHLDVLFWVDNGLMRLEDATPEQYNQAVQAWEEANGKKKVA